MSSCPNLLQRFGAAATLLRDNGRAARTKGNCWPHLPPSAPTPPRRGGLTKWSFLGVLPGTTVPPWQVLLHKEGRTRFHLDFFFFKPPFSGTVLAKSHWNSGRGKRDPEPPGELKPRFLSLFSLRHLLTAAIHRDSLERRLYSPLFPSGSRRTGSSLGFHKGNQDCL